MKYNIHINKEQEIKGRLSADVLSGILGTDGYTSDVYPLPSRMPDNKSIKRPERFCVDRSEFYESLNFTTNVSHWFSLQM